VKLHSAQTTPTRRFALALVGIALVVWLGTIGYIAIEGMTFVDALYMSVITVSTVGFEEVTPLSPVGRLFTIVLIVTGVGTVIYLLTTAAELVLEGTLREFFGRSAMDKRIHDLSEHVIICGFGRLGKAVVGELQRHAVPMVIIESDPSKENELMAMNLMYVMGSALEDHVMEKAALASARAVVVATASDADNVYIVLSVREKRPDIFIYARGDSEAGLRRLALAGANQTLSAYQSGGMRIAASILRPSVVDFLELTTPGRQSEIDLEEIRVGLNSLANGKTISEIERQNDRVRVVALKHGEDAIAMIPNPDFRIAAGDLLVVIGENKSLQNLSGL
jgi:voltage-gated potassium channel